MNLYHWDTSIQFLHLFQAAASLDADHSGKKNHPTNSGIAWDDGGKFVRSEGDYMYRAHADLASGFPGTTGNLDLGFYCEFTLATNPADNELYYYAWKSDYNTENNGFFIRYQYISGMYRLTLAIGDGTDFAYGNVYNSASPLSTDVRYCLGVSFTNSSKAVYEKLIKKSDLSMIGEEDTTIANNMDYAASAFGVGARLTGGNPASHSAHFDGTIHLMLVSNSPLTEGSIDALAAESYGSTEHEIKCYIDWNNDGDFEDSEEDCSADLLGVPKIYVGRNGDLAYDQAATCEIRLDNSSGKYSSEYGSGPVYGQIIPNIRVKVDVVFQGNTYTRFKGFYKNITLKVKDNKKQGEAIIRAAGPLSQFTESNTDIAVKSSQRTDECMQDILDADGWAAGDTDLDTCLTTMLRWFPKLNVNRIRLMRQLETMEKGRLHESFAGKICMKNRNYLGAAPYDSPQATFDNQTLKFWNIKQLNTNDGSDVCNEYRAEYNTYYVTAANSEIITVTDVENDLGGDPPYVPFGETVNIWVTLSNSTYKAVQTWGTPSKKAFTNKNGTGTDLTASISIVVTGYAQRAKLAITNNHGSLNAYITKLICLGTAVLFGDSAEALGTDSTSQGKYGRKEFKEPGQYYAGPVEAQDHADHVIDKYKDDRIKLKFEVDGTYDPNHMLQCLTREVADRIHVEATLADTGLAVDADFVIDSIELQMRSVSNFKMIIVCTRAPTATLAATSVTYTPETWTDPDYIETGGAAADVNAGATTISGTKITAGTIAADRMNVSYLSAIVADLGTITAGTVSGITLTGGTVQTSASGARAVMTAANPFRAYSASALQVEIDTNGYLYTGQLINIDHTSTKINWASGSPYRISFVVDNATIMFLEAGTPDKVDITGNLDVDGDFLLGSGHVIKNNGIQVLAAQGAAVADATGSGDAYLRLNELLARVRTHGIIAT